MGVDHGEETFHGTEAKKMIGIKPDPLGIFRSSGGNNRDRQRLLRIPESVLPGYQLGSPWQVRPFVDGFSKEEYYQFLEQIG